MERRPNRSRSAEGKVPPRVRLLSLLLDWAVWGYMAYGVVYFLNHYWYRVHVDWYGTLTLPPWGWGAVAGGTLLVALLSRATGRSVGLRAFGLEPSPGSRALYLLGALFSLALCGGGAIGGFVVGRALGGRFAPEALAALAVALGVSILLVRFPLPEGLSGREPRRSPEIAVAPPRPWYRTLWGLTSLLVLAMTAALGWHITEANLQVLMGEAGKARRLWGGFIRPDFSYFLAPDPWLEDSVLGAIVESVLMALLATVLGAAVAFPLSFLGARNLMARNPVGMAVYRLVRGFFNVFRSVESVLWASIFAVWVGWGPFAGTMALLIHAVAALGKLYSEQAEHIDPGPLEAVAATGASPLEVIRYAVIPQISPPYLAFTLYRWEINLRMATVVGLVGGGGIGRLLFYYQKALDWPKVGAVSLAVAVVVWALDYISARVRERIV